MAIQGKQRQVSGYEKPEVKYRTLEGLNQSMLKTFDENPMQFFEEFIMGKPGKQKKSVSFIIGDLVDFYLLDCHMNEDEFVQRMGEQFAISEGSNSSAQAFLLADKLFDLTVRDTNEDGEATTDFRTRFTEAFETVQKLGKYSGKGVDKGLEDFEKVARNYYQAKIENLGKTIVDQVHIEKAKYLVETLRYDDNFGNFINQESEGKLEVIKKVAIQFPYMGLDCKGEVDFLHVDHRNRQIRRRDLKTNYDNESFEYGYLKYGYYIQNSFYHKAVEHFAVEHGLEDYEITPMDFLVLDTSKNSRKPLLYTTTTEHVEAGLKGFTYRDNYYRGVEELMEEINWHNETQIWNISKTNFDNKGVVPLKMYL
jgi:hypothetical protein